MSGNGKTLQVKEQNQNISSPCGEIVQPSQGKNTESFWVRIWNAISFEFRRRRLAGALSRTFEIWILNAISLENQSGTPKENLDDIISIFPTDIQNDVKNGFHAFLKIAIHSMCYWLRKKLPLLKHQYEKLDLLQNQITDKVNTKNSFTISSCSSPVDEDLKKDVLKARAVRKDIDNNFLIVCIDAFLRYFLGFILLFSDAIAFFTLFQAIFPEGLIMVCSITLTFLFASLIASEWAFNNNKILKYIGTGLLFFLGFAISFLRIDILSGNFSLSLLAIYIILGISLPLLATGAAFLFKSGNKAIKDSMLKADSVLTHEMKTNVEFLILQEQTIIKEEQKIQQKNMQIEKQKKHIEDELTGSGSKYEKQAGKIERLIKEAENEVIRRLRPVIRHNSFMIADTYLKKHQ